jgi:hypothetical protein
MWRNRVDIRRRQERPRAGIDRTVAVPVEPVLQLSRPPFASGPIEAEDRGKALGAAGSSTQGLLIVKTGNRSANYRLTGRSRSPV